MYFISRLLIVLFISGTFTGASDFSFTHPDFSKQKLNSSGLFFKGYTYISSKEWTVWVNDLRLSPSSQVGKIKVLEALPNSVTFEWSSLGKTMVVTLAPGDSYEYSY